MAEIEQDLKGELEGLVNAIINKEHYHLETIEEALETLCELKLLKFNATPSLGRGHIVPEEFRCPITDELMADPVILASGQVGSYNYLHYITLIKIQVYNSFLC